MTATEDTIVAVSSPPGRSPRGLIRCSGPASRDILMGLLDPGSPPALPREPAPLPPRTLTACRIRIPACDRAGGAAPSLPLPAFVSFFPAPRSYTGQDMAELQCPGNPALLDRLVRRVTQLGGRLAEPGEFTFRAFLAGKLDLTQAEGIAATIAAVSDGQLQAAALLRQGSLGRFAHGLVDALADQLALIEAGIDFTDQEDVVPVPPGTLDDRLARVDARLGDLLGRSRPWSALESLPRVVLVGRPSTGKSTLFNALLGRERAVTSPLPGTTRDVLMEPLTLRDVEGRCVEVMLVDVAGLDSPQGALDRDVQAAARWAIRSADLLLYLHDAGEHLQLDTDFAAWLQDGPTAVPPVVRVRTKADLAPAPGKAAPASDADVAVSAVTGQGLDALRAAIAQRLGGRAVSIAAEALALQPRHESALRQAREHLEAARALLTRQRAARHIDRAELVAGYLRQALDELAGLGGRMTPDDVIGRVFARFCIGK